MSRDLPDATLMIKSARVRVLLLIVCGLTATVTGVWILQGRFGYGGNAGTLPARDVTPAATPGAATAASPTQSDTSTAATALATPEELP